MSRFIFISAFLWSLSQPIWAQLQKKQGLSVGIDLSPFVVRVFEDERTGLAFSGRLGFRQKWYGVAEAGYENASAQKVTTFYEGTASDLVETERVTYGYESNGAYVRAGVDYDIFGVSEKGNNDNIFLGFRYGFGWQQQSSDRYEIIDDYWGSFEGSLGSSIVNSHWAEVVFGLRAEIFRNLYMGWSLRLRQLIGVVHSGIQKPYLIPGYGKYDNKTNLGFTYTLEYQIPFRQRKSHSIQSNKPLP